MNLIRDLSGSIVSSSYLNRGVFNLSRNLSSGHFVRGGFNLSRNLCSAPFVRGGLNLSRNLSSGPFVRAGFDLSRSILLLLLLDKPSKFMNSNLLVGGVLLRRINPVARSSSSLRSSLHIRSDLVIRHGSLQLSSRSLSSRSLSSGVFARGGFDLSRSILLLLRLDKPSKLVTSNLLAGGVLEELVYFFYVDRSIQRSK